MSPSAFQASHPALPEVRRRNRTSRQDLPVVLQRIAVVYLVAALAWLHLGPRSRVALTLSLLAGYWLAMVLIPVPGHGAGDLSPDGNLAGWLDHLVLGRHT